MMDHDAQAICGPRHARGHERQAHRWGKTKGKIGFHGGKVEIERPRLRGFDGREQAVPSWEAAVAEDWLGKWAMNQMLINVSTRKFARSVRLPERDVPAPAGAGLSKSAASRRFVALSATRMKEWIASDLSGLDLLVIQIDGIHMDEDLILVAAIGVDAKGDKHPLGLAEGATENAATVQALIDNLVERGLDPAVPRLFIIDGAKALSKAIRRTFGRAAAIQRCQVHKARNIMERLPKSLHASVRRVLREALELDDADKAEKLIRNLAQRLERRRGGIRQDRHLDAGPLRRHRRGAASGRRPARGVAACRGARVTIRASDRARHRATSKGAFDSGRTRHRVSATSRARARWRASAMQEIAVVEPGYLTQQGIDVDQERLAGLTSQSKTVVFLLRQGRPLGRSRWPT